MSHSSSRGPLSTGILCLLFGSAFLIEFILFGIHLAYPDLLGNSCFMVHNEMLCCWLSLLVAVRRLLIPLVVLILYFSLNKAFDLLRREAPGLGIRVPRTGWLMALLLLWFVAYYSFPIIESVWGIPYAGPFQYAVYAGYIVLCLIVQAILMRGNASPTFRILSLAWLLFTIDITLSAAIRIFPNLVFFHLGYLLSALALGKIFAILLFTRTVASATKPHTNSPL